MRVTFVVCKMLANADICYVSYIALTLVCVANVGYLGCLSVQQIYCQLHKRKQTKCIVFSGYFRGPGTVHNSLQIHCLFQKLGISATFLLKEECWHWLTIFFSTLADTIWFLDWNYILLNK